MKKRQINWGIKDWLQTQLSHFDFLTPELLKILGTVFASLLVIHLINLGAYSVVGSGTALVFLYVFPIWYATWVHSKLAGFITVLVTSTLMSFTQPSNAPIHVWLLNTVALTVMMILMDRIDKNFSRAKFQASTDPLTNVLNRRAFEQEVKAEFRRTPVRSNSVSHALLVIDCDRFKTINDCYGHAFGDQALRKVAKALKSASDDKPIVGRLGGDEFAILLPNTDPVGAKIAISRIQNALEIQTQHLPFNVSVSIGSAFFPLDGITLEELISRADMRMFQQKNMARQYAQTACVVGAESDYADSKRP